METYVIKNIDFSIINEAFELIKEVFIEFNAPDYGKEGIDEFINKIIENKEFINLFRTGEQMMMGAFKDNKIIGVLGISVRNQISLLFVDKRYHKKGIATKLFNEVLIKLITMKVDKITLNSAPYALEFYKKLGFIATGRDQIRNGIKYIPMEFKLQKNCN